MYVGKTNNLKARLRLHIRNPTSGGMRRWINELSKLGMKPEIETLEACEGNEWVDRERFHVSDFKARFPDLLNVRRGGVGALDEHYTEDVRAAMSAKARAYHSRLSTIPIVQHVRILNVTWRKLKIVAKTLGFHYNPIGRLLDMCADLIVSNATFMSLPRRGYGSVPAATVRAIRRSREKIAVMSLEHGVSEAMCSKIRARKRYRWVR